MGAGAARAGFGDEDEAAGGDDVDPAAGAGGLSERCALAALAQIVQAGTAAAAKEKARR